ncbi:exodeoxyribonuclease V subunit gamma [Skermania sp. ID1734]|uniref:exodeoxyribonuclease V subunit gamma n=1 Tax=Skermania sp. ID1734 TaxID=2597516 RepID=UPI00117C1888|nr:exodeoxyribonuclease V subunit gamma [Skermania sp. ID1734]TSE01442.1 exodeoxyribonuclease V subunit gamma [Skermania sp. ID1734]
MLVLHRATRTDALADELAGVLAAPLSDPFASEIIAVPAKGVERWLNQRLAARLGSQVGDGVAANIEFPYPGALVGDVVARASGIAPDEDPWAADRSLWTVLSLIDSAIDEPWCAVLARHIGGSGPGDGHRLGRRYATASYITDLFARYGVQRPQLIIDWSRGNDCDGAGNELDDDVRWQPQLWRRLRERIGVASPAERLAEACLTVREQPEAVQLPERISVFGPTRLALGELAVLEALGAHRDVHLWIPHPSPAMWARLAESPPTRRRTDTSALTLEHPLLVSLGRDIREFQARLLPVAHIDRNHDAESGAVSETLLAQLQTDIRADRRPSAGSTPDGSVQIHACHGAARQVEVLRDVLLREFRNDPTLEPRDVLVMCPDIETYAPLIRAGFGQGSGGHPAHSLRVRLADRALRQTNPLLDVVATLLDLADRRITASQVLDLAASAPVCAGFGFSGDDLERLRAWAAESGARWGIGQRQRQAFGLDGFGQNTFNAALDRILLGAAADEFDCGWLDRATPLADVESADIDLAGRFAEFIDRLAATMRDLAHPQPARQWIETLGRALELLTDTAPDDAWQTAQARTELSAATEHAGDVVLRLADVRSMLAQRLAGRPTRANFRTGELTVCTMVPMRSVPHRVVVLLGLDDEVFPRAAGIDGDDILLRDPCTGERDPRSEDRQLLLDAVMAAEERLLLFYTGADPVTGNVRPPAIPLREVVDVIEAMVGVSALPNVLRRHPLQPFDPRNFDAVQPFSFDRDALAGARSCTQPAAPPPPFLPAALDPLIEESIDLADLAAFISHPVQGFLRQRLGIKLVDRNDEIDDALSIELDPLSKWDIGERMLAASLSGVDAAKFLGAEWRRGTLPPFELGKRAVREVEGNVASLESAVRRLYSEEPQAIDVAVDLGDGRRLTGTVTGLRSKMIVRTSYSRLAPKHRLNAWVQLLALACSTHENDWRTCTTGRAPKGRRPYQSTLAVPPQPEVVLRQLVALRDHGLCEPLPIAAKASAAYAERRFRGDAVADALTAAEKEWADAYGDATDADMIYLHGPTPRFEHFIAAKPAATEGETTTFGVLSRQLWDPLLTMETVGPA